MINNLHDISRRYIFWPKESRVSSLHNRIIVFRRKIINTFWWRKKKLNTLKTHLDKMIIHQRWLIEKKLNTEEYLTTVISLGAINQEEVVTFYLVEEISEK